MQKKQNKFSQKFYLFFVYGIFILILLGIFFSFTYSYYKKISIRDNTKTSINMCTLISDSVNDELNTMSSLSMNIIYSNEVKRYFKSFSKYYTESIINSESIIDVRKYANMIHSIITAITGGFESTSNVILYNLDGFNIELGYSMTINAIDLESLPWYDETISLNGHKYISKPVHYKGLPASGINEKSRMFLSLYRTYHYTNGPIEGIVSITQDCNTVFSLASQVEEQNPGTKVFIYNERNEQVFPYKGQADTNYYTLIKDEHLKKDSGNIITLENKEKYLCTYQTLKDYDWQVILLQPYTKILAPITTFRNSFIIVATLSILFTLFICFYISERLTLPLRKLTKATENITINRVLDENKALLTSADSNIQELSLLCNAIREMYEKLRQTTQDALLSKKEEVRAQLQATQSLINPHFLYNSLTNLSIMAEEEMNEDIISMCESLCNYLRYISSSSDMIVDIKTEMFYTVKYLECMRYRFIDNFNFDLQMSPESESVWVPKFIVQPFIENVFKYAFSRPTLWKLDIRAYTKDNYWYIEVEDNGGLLTEETKNNILNACKNIDTSKELKLIQLGGLGIKNTYIRLKLFYGDKMIFRISTKQYVKTVITVGGPILEKNFYNEKLIFRK